MRRRPPARTGRRCFTLLELLVSFALAAMLAALVASTFSAVIQTHRRLREHTRLSGDLRRAYEILARDFHSAVRPPDDTGLLFGLSGTPAAAGSNVLQMAAGVGEPLLAGRVANETVLLQYAIQEDPRSGLPTLYRFETPYPIPDGSNGLSVPADPTGQSGDTRITPLITGVTGATYLFFSLSQENWVENWDTETETGLPDAVRIDLLFEDPEGRGQPRQESWIFHIPAARGSDDSQPADPGAASQAGGGA